MEVLSRLSATVDASEIFDAIDDYTTGADLEVDDDSLEDDEEEVEAE